MSIESKLQRRGRRNSYKVKSVVKSDRARLSVFRSNEHIYAQLISDAEGKTLASASTVDKALRAELKSTGTIESAQKVGEAIAKRAIEAGVKDVYFDRGRFVYHGRVKALADAARAAGLNF